MLLSRSIENLCAAVLLAAVLSCCGRSAIAPVEKHVLVVRDEGPVDLKADGIDAAAYEGGTSDPAVIRIMAKGLSPFAIKVTQARGRHVLEWKGGKVFEAAVIGTIRFEPAGGGTLALEAITVPGGSAFPSRETEGPLQGNPWEAWIVRGPGQAERVSPPGVNATQPVISPNGRHVAFVSEQLAQGFLQTPELMIKDLKEGQVRSYGEKRHGGDYWIAPVDWVKEGEALTLRVVEDWGETGGHLALKQVRVE